MDYFWKWDHEIHKIVILKHNTYRIGKYCDSIESGDRCIILALVKRARKSVYGEEGMDGVVKQTQKTRVHVLCKTQS